MKVSDCKSTAHAAMNFNDTGFSFLIRGLVGSLERLEVPDASVCAAELVQLCKKMIFLFQFPSLRSLLTPSRSRGKARCASYTERIEIKSIITPMISFQN